MKKNTRSASVPVVRSVVNTLRVIEALARSQSLSVAELGRKVDLPKSTVFRALITLESAGWAQSSATPSAEWSLTNRVFELAMLAPRSSSALDAAVAWLPKLRDRYGETASLLVPSGSDLVVIAREDGTNPLRAYIQLGAKVSMASTASGRAYLSALPADDARSLLALRINSGDLKADSYEQVVWREVQRAQQRGYAIDDGSDSTEPRPAVVVGRQSPGSASSGVAGVAAAIVTSSGVAEGVITITMPSSVASFLDLDELGRHLAFVCSHLGEPFH